MAKKHWTETTIRAAFAQCTSRQDVWDRYPRAAVVARRDFPGLIDEYFPLTLHRWTVEEALAVAARYKSKYALQKAEPQAYRFLKKHKLLRHQTHWESATAAHLDGILDRIVQDPYTKVYPDGSLWTCRRERWRLPYRLSEERRFYVWGRVEVNFLMTENRFVLNFTDTDGRRHGLTYARLVYKACVGPLAVTEIVTFKDLNPANVAASNLEKVSKSDAFVAVSQATKKLQLNPRYKLTEAIAADMRADREKGATFDVLTKKYRVCKSTVSYVVNKKIWK